MILKKVEEVVLTYDNREEANEKLAWLRELPECVSRLCFSDYFTEFDKKVYVVKYKRISYKVN